MDSIKRTYRGPEWLDAENTVFINELNFVTKHFRDVYSIVSYRLFILLIFFTLDEISASPI